LDPLIAAGDPLLLRLRSLERNLQHASAGDLLLDRATYPIGARIVTQGEFHTGRFMAAGWAYRQRVLADGRRQVLGFDLPGDMLGVCAPGGERASFSVFAATPVTVVNAMPVFKYLVEAQNHGSSTSLHSALVTFERELLFSQMIRLGRQTAIERIAHFLLELHYRLRAVKLAAQYTFQMPLTQELLADALGLSVVHVNRVLQQLRRDNLIQLASGKVLLLQPELLRAIGEFDGTNLAAQPVPSSATAVS
jgi:CRP-like cAMP-binding protein